MHRLLSSALLTFSLICSQSACSIPLKAQEVKITYPPTKTTDQTDDFHGTTVADPYRWLEDDVRVSKDSAAWVQAQ
ncbi:MAG: S9 family peptidase, partial [Planctomycetaceae bacterium]